MASAIRSWLQKHPVPDTVRGTDADDEERSVKLGVARSRWKDAEAALEGCWYLEALDAHGNVLRVFEADEPPARAGAKKSETELAQLARIIADVADQAAARHENAYRMAFEQQVALVRMLSERLIGFEKAWQKMVMQSGEPAPADAGFDADSLVKQLLVAQVASSAAGNGKAAP